MDIEYSKEDLALIKEMSGPIGIIVLQWSNVDRYIDWWIKIISEDHDINNIINPDSLYQNIGKKLPLLKKCFEYPSLINFREKGLCLIKRIEVTAKERNDIVHGIFDGINPDKSINFQCLKRPKKELKYNIRQITHTVSSLIDLGKRIQVLATDVGLFGLSLREQ